MPIYDDISVELKESMRARNKARTQALRGIRAAFIAKLKEDNADTLSDEVCLVLLRKLAKQRLESIEAYEKGGRDDLVAEEQSEFDVLSSFLPQLADEATTRAWIEEEIAATGATSMKDMGKVMGKLMAAHKSDIDGKLASRLVRDLLS
ncbi:MAG: GatB/YqeY domain-containing protein [Proteobacteria bacterium]|jgi:uncharacterized protein|nr:GatB/YqeY domain-containing protein [Pseudomonadota bacterium]